MNAKIDAPTPQRICVPEGTVLQIYSRDAHGNKMLMNLPGPVDVSIVPIESAGNRVIGERDRSSGRNSDHATNPNRLSLHLP
jgi:hypothetical protein